MEVFTFLPHVGGYFRLWWKLQFLVLHHHSTLCEFASLYTGIDSSLFPGKHPFPVDFSTSVTSG